MKVFKKIQLSSKGGPRKLESYMWPQDNFKVSKPFFPGETPKASAPELFANAILKSWISAAKVGFRIGNRHKRIDLFLLCGII